MPNFRPQGPLQNSAPTAQLDATNNLVHHQVQPISVPEQPASPEQAQPDHAAASASSPADQTHAAHNGPSASGPTGQAQPASTPTGTTDQASSLQQSASMHKFEPTASAESPTVVPDNIHPMKT
ncbi:hypothetical protein L1987_32322 [Smallanthus sonchifolius]|uniref:Uncharacterized protein n=1 Tax=Smallanthus sonchifolius TaxID=185202 RepID=A0ACB9I830_9ASTR|nr:hypothetical protein L1987_32322 [Smallanthus sonchifolius]